MNFLHRLAAYAELLGRYRGVLRQAWGRRNDLDNGGFTKDEADFLPSALALLEQPVSPTSRLTARVLIGLLMFLLVWSYFGHIDIIVNGQGKIISSGRSKMIASIDVASVRALHVVEGQLVRQGDLLVELDTSASDAERDKALADLRDSALLTARSRAMIAAVDSLKPPLLSKGDDIARSSGIEGVGGIETIEVGKLREAQLHLNGQFQDFLAKLHFIDGALARLERLLPLVSKRAADYRELAEEHAVPRHAYLEKEQARLDLEGQISEAKNQRAVLLAETKRQAYDALAEGEHRISTGRQDALRAASHSRLLHLTAPVDGTVQQLNVHTVGGVVPAAQPLMVIVPQESRLEIEALLENKDVGFVEEGQPAAVKIDAFEYTKYGVMPARVVHVSRDAIENERLGPVYSVKVALDRSSLVVRGREVDLIPGMSVRVEIKTGERRVIEYALSPLLQHGKESFNER